MEKCLKMEPLQLLVLDEQVSNLGDSWRVEMVEVQSEY